jgi:osmoprotectant transport system ATP-binding protein
VDATATPAIRLDGVRKTYPDGTVAVGELSLDVADGEVCVLVGPSGCGKSTTLRLINRLIEPTGGRIFLEGEDVTTTDPVRLRRRMGYVIQQAGLFPHQSVRTNVATVPRLLGWDRSRTAGRVDEMLELVGLEPKTYGDRYPYQLSGGQRQRVGVARALAADPPVLLMDEPFGAVDPIQRDRLQGEFLRLQREVRKTVVFVTHDIEEAVRLGDRIAVLSQSAKVEQYADPPTLLGAPANDFVADFVGADRGVKRLAVTRIDPAVLHHPPAVRPDDDLAEARRVLQREGARWALVTDADDRLHGWVDRSDAGGSGRVADCLRPVPARVAADGTLRDALAALLGAEAGWVAVVDDADRPVGVFTPERLHAAVRRSTESLAG